MAKAHGIEGGSPTPITALLEESELPALAPWPPFPENDVISGDPNGHRGVVLYRDPTRRYSVGVWECPPAKFIDTNPGTEFAHVISGRATLTNEKTGHAVTLKAGDHFIVAHGSKIIWEVHETFRKIYTIYEEEWIEERYY